MPFTSFNNQLFNDKAIAVRTPYLNKELEMITYTDCVAMIMQDGYGIFLSGIEWVEVTVTVGY